MKTRPLISAGLLIAASAFVAGTAFPQDGEKDQMAEMMKWMSTGPEHKVLETFVGEFDTEWKIWMGGSNSGTPPMITKGTSTTTWQLPGRFTRTEYSHSMMGMPMTGFSIMGYDRYRKEFEIISGHTMDTALYSARGTSDDDGKRITVNGLMDEPSMDMKDKKVKTIIRIVDADTYIWETHDMHLGGDNTKVFEVTFTRKKE